MLPAWTAQSAVRHWRLVHQDGDRASILPATGESLLHILIGQAGDDAHRPGRISSKFSPCVGWIHRTFLFGSVTNTVRTVSSDLLPDAPCCKDSVTLPSTSAINEKFRGWPWGLVDVLGLTGMAVGGFLE